MEASFNEQVAQYIHEYLRIEYSVEDENLTLNQLLGKELLFSLDKQHYEVLLDKFSHHDDDAKASFEDEAMDEKLSDAFTAHLDEHEKTLLSSKNSNETDFEGIRRNLKEFGYKFDANYIIDIGKEAKQLDDLIRLSDQTGYGIGYLSAPVHHPMNRDRFIVNQPIGNGVLYTNIPKVSEDYITFDDKEKGFGFTHNFDIENFVLGFDKNEYGLKILAKIQKNPSLKASINDYESDTVSIPGHREFTIYLEKNDKNTLPLLQLLLKEKLLNHATCETIKKAINQRSQNLEL